MAVLPPLVGSSRGMERESSDLLQRPAPKGNSGQISRNVSGPGLAEDIDY